MSDAPNVATLPSAEANSVSMETFEQLKRELAAKTEEAARASARSQVFEDRERGRIGAWQDDCKSYITELIETGDAETKSDLQPLTTWAEEYSKKADIIAQVPLARLVSCASKTLKRTRDEASQLKSGSEQLSATMKELETARADNESLRQRVGELETLATDRQKSAEVLQEQLAKFGYVPKSNFSQQSSREKDAAAPSEPAAAIDAPLTAVTANASKGATANPLEQDRLMDEIMSRGAGSLRMLPSSTIHPHLGSTDGSGAILSAIRNAL